MKPVFTILLCILVGKGLIAQDHCSEAVVIPPGSYSLGTFFSENISLANASVEQGEYFAPVIANAGLTDKSVWYRFSLPVTRKVSITLAQTGTTILPGEVGFTVYKGTACLPTASDVHTFFSPIPDFGSTAHNCISQGEYLIQVSAKNHVTDSVYIRMDLSDSTDATFDNPWNAQIITPSSGGFDVSCQTIADSSELCNSFSDAAEFTKSTWHTFVSRNYFDALAILIKSNNCAPFPNGPVKFGYRLFRGNCRTQPLSDLILVDGCDSIMSEGIVTDKKIYRCGALDFSTAYTIQLLYHKDFEGSVSLQLNYDGFGFAGGANPVFTAMTPNHIGELPASIWGVNSVYNDFFGCNSRHNSALNCAVIPSQGIEEFGRTFNLSTFFTFQLQTAAQIELSAVAACNVPLLLRLYNQFPGNDCADLDTANIIERFLQQGQIQCLPPGDYTLQISGIDSVQAPFINPLSPCEEQLSCMRTHLGKRINLVFNTVERAYDNQFSLAEPGKLYSVNALNNVMQPLVPDVLYLIPSDTFGCRLSVLPPATTGSECISDVSKVSYKTFLIGDGNNDGIPDSGAVRMAYYDSLPSYRQRISLYKGDANAIATAQQLFNFPDTLSALIPVSECRRESLCEGDYVCVTPGVYTIANFTDDNEPFPEDNSSKITFELLRTNFANPSHPDNLGSILDTFDITGSDSIYTQNDWFSCIDNAVPINGFGPPELSPGIPATKAIYREFHLKHDAAVEIMIEAEECGGGAFLSLFSGRISDNIDSLQVIEINEVTLFGGRIRTEVCDPLPEGWYTIVTYGRGPTYEEPMKELNYPLHGGYIGMDQRLLIIYLQECGSQKFERPYKAAVDTNTGAPFVIDWLHQPVSTAAYPVTNNTINLPVEFLNCTADSSLFPFPVLPCDPTHNRASYYVFEVTRESYVEINTYDVWAMVYSLDVRFDSMMLSTTQPIQSCMKSEGYIQICRMQPGIYSLLLFAGPMEAGNGCGNIKATIYIDSVGYSRFDHAINAYDFGVIPADGNTYLGKPGDVNPFHPDRAPSNDFIFCTTGAASSDPRTNPCGMAYNSNVYNPNPNNALYNMVSLPPESFQIRRNLWYTFVADSPGEINIHAFSKTTFKRGPLKVWVFKSDEDGTLPFTTLQATGAVDSTFAQGLTLVAQSFFEPFCDSIIPVRFKREVCSSPNPNRYYILVENINAVELVDMRPNHQVEVAVEIRPTFAITTEYDLYADAAEMGTLIPGLNIGPEGNFECATYDPVDPVSNISCSNFKTLWYKFSIDTTASLYYHIPMGNTVYAGIPNQYLFRSIVPGDSTLNGLEPVHYYRVRINNQPWDASCVYPGTYYLILSGLTDNCDSVNRANPELLLRIEGGDFCSEPISLSISGDGVYTAEALPDCHTIGLDPGEGSATLSCPSSAVRDNYRSTWFKLSITGTDTMDFRMRFSGLINLPQSSMHYRFLKGDCDAMQEIVCVNNTGTVNTYTCLPPGDYYVQLFTAVEYNGNPARGPISLQVTASRHLTFCTPAPPCPPFASFSYVADCNISDAVQFVNHSPVGQSVEYLWQFGYDNQTSTALNPAFVYPPSPTDQTYSVTLIVTNHASVCGSDTLTLPVLVPARPFVEIGNDTTICSSDFVINATSWNGSAYQWQDGFTGAQYPVQLPGNNLYAVTVTYNGCSISDSIFVNLVQRDSVFAVRELCESELPFVWNNIAITSAGRYFASQSGNECDTLHVLDVVITPSPAAPLVENLNYCAGEDADPLTAQTAPGNTLLWYDHSNASVPLSSAPVPVTTTPSQITYYVSAYNDVCESDRVPITVSVFEMPELGMDSDSAFCEDQPVDLTALHPSGGWSLTWLFNGNPIAPPTQATISGLYQVIAANEHCADTARIDLVMLPSPVANAGRDTTVTGTVPVQLWGSGNGTYRWWPPEFLNDPSLSNPVANITSTSLFVLEVTNDAGCKATDSVLITVLNKPGFLMPSAFTPNGDGLNDIYKPLPGMDIRFFSMRIYNRFGQIIFQSYDPEKGWDGTFRGKEQNTGTYVWVLKGINSEGKLVTHSGTVILLRAP